MVQYTTSPTLHQSDSRRGVAVGSTWLPHLHFVRCCRQKMTTYVIVHGNTACVPHTMTSLRHPLTYTAREKYRSSSKLVRVLLLAVSKYPKK